MVQMRIGSPNQITPPSTIKQGKLFPPQKSLGLSSSEKIDNLIFERMINYRFLFILK